MSAEDVLACPIDSCNSPVEFSCSKADSTNVTSSTAIFTFLLLSFPSSSNDFTYVLLISFSFSVPSLLNCIDKNTVVAFELLLT